MDITSSFHDRLQAACSRTDSHLCVGIDPRREYLPPELEPKADTPEAVAYSYLSFSKAVIDAVCAHVPIIKPQSAFFEAQGHWGVRALEELCAHAHKRNILVLGDVKRGDIGTTAEAYAEAAFRKLGDRTLFDAVTVNPYMGIDGIQPFIDKAKQVGGGVFVLCKTSNPSSVDLQDLTLMNGKPLHQHVASLISSWGKHSLGTLGAVVGATHPKELAVLRSMLSQSWILIPGVGAQGGTLRNAMAGFDKQGSRALVSASRSIIFPWLSSSAKNPSDWRAQITNAAVHSNIAFRKIRANAF